ncbi:MAG: hypothetical protein R2784_01460 [Saprospiraceae bacterium]
MIEYNTLRIVSALEWIGSSRLVNPTKKAFEYRTGNSTISLCFHELAHIVSELKELKKSGYPLEEVAILYAKHRQSKIWFNYLTALPFHFKSKAENQYS